MQVISEQEFRKQPKKYLLMTTDGFEPVAICCSKEKNIVLINLDEYNSIQETFYLSGSRANQQRLDDSVIEMKKGNFISTN
jgi:antitoxin YefM